MGNRCSKTYGIKKPQGGAVVKRGGGYKIFGWTKCCVAISTTPLLCSPQRFKIGLLAYFWRSSSIFQEVSNRLNPAEYCPAVFPLAG